MKIVPFCQICPSGTGDFPEIYKISPFIILSYKTAKITTSRKETLHFPLTYESTGQNHLC